MVYVTWIKGFASSHLVVVVIVLFPGIYLQGQHVEYLFKLTITPKVIILLWKTIVLSPCKALLVSELGTLKKSIQVMPLFVSNCRVVHSIMSFILMIMEHLDDDFSEPGQPNKKNNANDLLVRECGTFVCTYIELQ